MTIDSEDKKDDWIQFLYFAYKKAKHFVTNETSFVNNIEIIKFEEKLEVNIKRLANLIKNTNMLEKEIKAMKGHLYFVPKSFGPNKEARIRPKVAFPFEYQILWAAIILRIGEWFDTNNQLKNVYSMRDENLRKKLEWMVPWSFNGRIKRITTKNHEDLLQPSYIHYNDNRLYESHQMALRKFHKYESEVTKKLFEKNSKVYKATLDIHEFFPTLEKKHIKKMFETRFENLKKIKEFNVNYFNPDHMQEIIDVLLNLDIVYPDSVDDTGPFVKVLEEYFKKLTTTKIIEKKNSINEQNYNIQENSISQILSILNQTLPLDLIASNFLSNCVLNEFIDTELNSKLENNELYILRYTDDYKIVSHDKEKIIKAITIIKSKLADIGLTYSPIKTLPTTVEDVKDKLDFIQKEEQWGEHYNKIKEWFLSNQLLEKYSSISNLPNTVKKELKEKAQIVLINIDPEEIDEDDIVNELTLTKLSTTSDIKLQALSDKELEMHIGELMLFMKGDVGELKDETAKIFAAWRLNASHQEQTYRKTHEVKEIKLFLKQLEMAIKKYPYKLGFYDIYILILLKIIEHSETGYKELEMFLVNIKGIIKTSFEAGDNQNRINNSDRFLSSCFPAIRIKILNLFSSNWKRFNEDERTKLRSILEKVFLTWYAEPRVQWNELYVMYSCFSILRIRLPLGISEVKDLHPNILLELKVVYNDYFFLPENKQLEENSQNDGTFIAIAIRWLKIGLYWDKHKRHFTFNEVDQLIYKNIKDELAQTYFNPYVSLAFARIAPERLDSKDWKSLFENWPVNELEMNSELLFETLDFLQLNIQWYFEKPDTYTEILDWAFEKKGESILKKYVKDRFSSFSKIRSHFSLTDDKYSRLSINNDENTCLPIADWVFYAQTLPYHLETNNMKQKVLHPLTEYDFVRLLDKIFNNIYKSRKTSNDNDHPFDLDRFIEENSPLFKLKMTPTEWSNFRQEKKKDEKTCNRTTESGNVEDDIFLGTQSDKNTTRKLVKSLFTLLTNRPWHIHVQKDFSMYKWNDLQSYFEMAYYPSTSIATLFVNNLNIHQNFYSEIYKMPLEELPYSNIYTREKTNNIKLWIEYYIKKQAEKQVHKTDNRKLELLEINIDQLRR